jgi:hypothetical protein
VKIKAAAICVSSIIRSMARAGLIQLNRKGRMGKEELSVTITLVRQGTS